MALYRPTPTCIHCGKLIARAIYKVRLPGDTFIGDDFIRWDDFECDCEESKDFLNKRNKDNE